MYKNSACPSFSIDQLLSTSQLIRLRTTAAMDLTQQILDLASKGPPQLEEADRLALLHAVQKLNAVLETPVERFTREFSVCDSALELSH